MPQSNEEEEDQWHAVRTESLSSTRIVFRIPPWLRPDECWQERPVRRTLRSSSAPAVSTSDVASSQGPPHQQQPPLPPPPQQQQQLCFKSNTGVHGVHIVQIVLRDHGFRRAPPLLMPRLNRTLRRSWFFRGAPGAEHSGGEAAAAAVAVGGRGCGLGGLLSAVDEQTPWSLEWRTGRIEGSDVSALLPHQKVNKFPGVSVLTLKHELWRHYCEMRSAHGTEHFDYMPQTFVLPEEREAWEAARRRDAKTTLVWIVKPSNTSRSRGIRLVRAEQSEARSEERSAEERSTEHRSGLSHGVACAYIHPPLLLDGRKFDVRLFVLVTSWHPLVTYLFEGGIARGAAAAYSLDGDLDSQGTAHFTNASISTDGCVDVRRTHEWREPYGIVWREPYGIYPGCPRR